MEEIKINTIIIEVPEDIIKKYDGFSILNLDNDYKLSMDYSKIPENYLEDEQFDYGQNYEDNDEQKDFNVQNNDEEDQNNQSNEEDNDDDNQFEQEDTYSDCAAYFKKIEDKYYIVYNSSINPNNLNQIAISAFYYNINDGEYYWDNIILPITLKNFAENSDKVIYVNINQNSDDNNLLTTNVEFKNENDCQEIINQYDSADKTDETIGRENAREIANIIIEIENYNDLLIDNCYIYEINETNQFISRLKISFEKIDNKLIATATLAEPYMKLNKNNQIAIVLYNKNVLVAYQIIEFSPNPNLNEIPYIKFDNEFSCTSGYLEISCAEKIFSDFENTTNQKNNSECLKVSDVALFENITNQKNNSKCLKVSDVALFENITNQKSSSKYLNVSDALSFENTTNQNENTTNQNENTTNQRSSNKYLNVSDALSFKNTANQKNNKIKRNLAIAIGIFLALGVAAVTALTFGWTLIPALLITKIAIGVGLALTIATFIYVAIKSKKIENDKCQNLGKSNSKDEISNNNDLDENNKNQEADELNNNVPDNLQQMDQAKKTTVLI